MEHSGSGEEVEWAPTAGDTEAASQPPKHAAAAAAAQPIAPVPGKSPAGVLAQNPYQVLLCARASFYATTWLG